MFHKNSDKEFVFCKSRKIHIKFKGTVSVILSDTPCKNDYTRYTTVPLKALSELHEGIEFLPHT